MVDTCSRCGTEIDGEPYTLLFRTTWEDYIREEVLEGPPPTAGMELRFCDSCGPKTRALYDQTKEVAAYHPEETVDDVEHAENLTPEELEFLSGLEPSDVYASDWPGA